MARILPFWPKSGILAWVTSSSSVADFIYTNALPTDGFSQVVAQLECDAKIAGDANTDILVTPQISNDGVSWKDATPAFIKIEQGSSYPIKEVAKIDTLGAFMRFKIGLWEEKVNGDVTVIIGGTLKITGTGRARES